VDPVERIERATAFAGRKVGAVTPADLTKPTPCAEFDVAALLNHMLGGLAMLTSAASGGTAHMPDGDQFGSDPGAVYDERRSALLNALEDTDVLDRTWEMPFGPVAGEMMARIAFMEHLTHAWDVATATEQDATLPPDLVTECMEVVTPMDAMLRIPGVCAEAVSVPDGATAQDKLIAFLGRTP
jgi:uncharacterized protein (TIGR03086 family)